MRSCLAFIDANLLLTTRAAHPGIERAREAMRAIIDTNAALAELANSLGYCIGLNLENYQGRFSQDVLLDALRQSAELGFGDFEEIAISDLPPEVLARLSAEN